MTGAPSLAQAFDYLIDDFTFYPPPRQAKPAKGTPAIDPVFNVTVTRITDAATEAESAGRSAFAGYPKHDIENADGTKLLVESICKSNCGIYDARSFDKLRCLSPAEYGFYKSALSPIDPRWDATDPNKLFFVRRMTFNVYDYASEGSTVLHDFTAEFPEPENIYLNLAEEGDGSWDRRTWAFGVTWHSGSLWKCYNVVTYDTVEDKVLGILKRPSGSCGNWVSATPLGKAALGTSPILVYDPEFKKAPVTIDASGGVHGDFALNDEGREVYFHGKAGWWRMEDLETGQTTKLIARDLGKGLGYHISGNAYETPGWGLVSTYAVGDKPASHWADYAIFLVELTNRTDPPPRIWRVAHTHSADRVSHAYSADPFAKFNTQGTKIFWTSNWDDPDGIRDIYQIDLPANWHQELELAPCSDGQVRACGIDSGACAKGTQRCRDGRWGDCEGAVKPIPEACGDGVDNDCDTVVDNGCNVPASAPIDGGLPHSADRDVSLDEVESGTDAATAGLTAEPTDAGVSAARARAHRTGHRQEPFGRLCHRPQDEPEMAVSADSRRAAQLAASERWDGGKASQE